MAKVYIGEKLCGTVPNADSLKSETVYTIHCADDSVGKLIKIVSDNNQLSFSEVSVHVNQITYQMMGINPTASSSLKVGLVNYAA